jgi:hypothetical protein
MFCKKSTLTIIIFSYYVQMKKKIKLNIKDFSKMYTSLIF